MNTVSTSAPPRRRAPLALAVAALVAALLALAGPASATAKTFNVNPVTGKDSNSGTATAPLKTLTRALKLVRSGDTVRLAGGGYGPGASGDQFPQSGLVVPAGVTIEGATDGGFPAATLLGPGSGAGLNLAGNATVRNLIWGGQGFGIGLYAKQGTQTLSNLFVGMPRGATANVDGVAGLNGGIFLRGSASATLKAGAAGANTTGSTIFLLSGGATGVSVNEQARFTMDGGTITGGDQPNCRTDASGIRLSDAAQATLTNMKAPGFKNLAGSTLFMRDTSKATLSNVLVFRELPEGCQPRPSVELNTSASLTMQSDTDLVQPASDRTQARGVGIQMRSSAPLKLLPTTGISGYDRGLQVTGGTGSLTLDNAALSNCNVCVDARAATGPITIANSSLTAGFEDSVGLIAPSFKMRNSLVSSNFTGVVVDGPGADLGTASDAGNNTIRNNVITGVKIDDTVASSLVLARGNTWEPNSQGADASGHYPQPLLVDGLNPLASGLNFDVRQFVASANARMLVGPGAAVGTFRLSPRTLTARAGRPAAWRLAWTHPLDWKRLDRVVLRLEARGRPVGRITLDQETRRVRAGGPAVTLVRGRSRIAGHAGGERLTAKIGLRISGRYAGRTLVAKLAASDDDGHRQGFRRAGRVRVLAR
jgi:Protein of unknown function (DUF1565)